MGKITTRVDSGDDLWNVWNEDSVDIDQIRTDNASFLSENNLTIEEDGDYIYLCHGDEVIGVAKADDMYDSEVINEFVYRYRGESIPSSGYQREEIHGIMSSLAENNSGFTCLTIHDGHYRMYNYTEQKGITVSGVDSLSNDEILELANYFDANGMTESNISVSSKISDVDTNQLEFYVQNLLGDSINGTLSIRLNDEGKYEIRIDNSIIGVLNNDANVVDVFNLIDIATRDLSPTNTIFRDNRIETTQLLSQTNQNYIIDIDEELFKNILDEYAESKEAITTCKTVYNISDLDGRLRESYDNLVNANADPLIKMQKIIDLLDILHTNIDYSLQAYTNIDHKLGTVFNSIVSDIFMVNRYRDNNDGINYAEMTHEERVDNLNQILQQYEQLLESLQSEFNIISSVFEGMNNGFVGGVPDRVYAIVDTLMQCFTADVLSGETCGGLDRNHVGYFSLDGLREFNNFAQENNLFEKVGSYLNGQTWRESGMSDFNEIILNHLSNRGSGDLTREYYINHGAIDFATKTTEVSKVAYDTETINSVTMYRVRTADGNSRLFQDDYSYGLYCYDLKADYFCESQFLNQFYERAYSVQPDLSCNRPITSDRGLYGDFDLSFPNSAAYESLIPIKNMMRDWFNEEISYDVRGTNYAPSYSINDYINQRISEFDLENFVEVKSIVQDRYTTKASDLALMRETVYQFKQYARLLPYEFETEKTDYLDYLCRDYSDYSYDGVVTEANYHYLQQNELALYEFLKSTDPTRAREYINCLTDTINQRKGYEEAAMRISEMSDGDIVDFLTMGAYGLADGVENFAQGICNFFEGIFGGVYDDNSDFSTVRSSESYRNMYMLSLLSSDNVYNSQLDEITRQCFSFQYSATSSVGTNAIPALISLIPGCQTVGTVLMGVSAAGNSMKETRLGGYSAVQSIIYGFASGASEVLMEKAIGGITGLNGNREALTGFNALLHSMGEEAREEFLQTYLDGALRSLVLQEPFDVSSLTGDALNAALCALYSTAIMNTTTSVMIKAADTVIDISSLPFNNYQELCNFVENKIRHPEHSRIDASTAETMGINLSEGEVLFYDDTNSQYYKIDRKGKRINIPSEFISDTTITLSSQQSTTQHGLTWDELSSAAQEQINQNKGTVGPRLSTEGSMYGKPTPATYNGTFDQDTVVILGYSGDDAIPCLIGDISDAYVMLEERTSGHETDTFELKVSAIHQTVTDYFGGVSNIDSRLSNYSDTYSIMGNNGRVGLVSDLRGQNSAVCVERAMLSQNLLKSQGINSTYVTGLIRNTAGNTENHAFNLIEYNGHYYIYDSTIPTTQNGTASPLIGEISESAYNRMINPRGVRPTFTSTGELIYNNEPYHVTHYDPLLDKDVDITYDYVPESRQSTDSTEGSNSSIEQQQGQEPTLQPLNIEEENVGLAGYNIEIKGIDEDGKYIVHTIYGDMTLSQEELVVLKSDMQDLISEGLGTGTDVRDRYTIVDEDLFHLAETHGLIDQHACRYVYEDVVANHNSENQQYKDLLAAIDGEMSEEDVLAILGSMDVEKGICSVADYGNRALKYLDIDFGVDLSPESRNVIVLFLSYVNANCFEYNASDSSTGKAHPDYLLYEDADGVTHINENYLARFRLTNNVTGEDLGRMSGLLPIAQKLHERGYSAFNFLRDSERLLPKLESELGRTPVTGTSVEHLNDPLIFKGQNITWKDHGGQNLDSISLRSGSYMYDFVTGEPVRLESHHIVTVLGESSSCYLVWSWDRMWEIPKFQNHGSTIYPMYSNPQ